MARPRIGIDLDHEHDGRRWIYKSPTVYLDAVVAAGGEPVLLPPREPETARAMLNGLDGLLMTGGDDVHPSLLGRKADGMPMQLLSVRRERFVLALADAVLESRIPTLAVCLGCQAVNLRSGGDLYLDLYTEHDSPEEHRNGHEHPVHPEPEGVLFRYWAGESQSLKSHHHQAIRRLGDGLALEAKAPDGVVEAFRTTSDRFLLGVQWHPEVQMHTPGGRRLIDALLEAAS